jgi:hypothetical protein
MSTRIRKYTGKDVDMLVACSTIIENAIANKTFLQSKRSNWTDDFFTNLQNNINNALEQHLGIDSAKNLRGATQTLLSIQKQALKDLAEVKVQIAEDFKKEPIKQNEILTQLGFTTYLKEAQKGDQEALVQLLYKFKTNLTYDLKNEIVSKGTAESILTQTTTYADTLKNADITQETFKGTRKEITETAIKAFNEIYDDVISIAKIASNFYKEEPVKKDLFSFTKINKTLSAQRKATTTENTPKP